MSIVEEELHNPTAITQHSRSGYALRSNPTYIDLKIRSICKDFRHSKILAKLVLEPTTHDPVLVKRNWRLIKPDPIVKLTVPRIHRGTVIFLVRMKHVDPKQKCPLWHGVGR
uniref:Uncharacterized protein n=1 Tax=Candidatus Kentrum sp. LFY TaxID=2126342 RepID=A0A450US48_9GAMM|nr:MAG: hypothetical protein BECKLFY1418A_GA0070994_10493 [Candidatus Kentron sp. LFY]